MLSICATKYPNARISINPLIRSCDGFIIKAKGVAKSNNKFAGELAHHSGKKIEYLVTEFRTDGDRRKRITYRWGDYNGPGGKIYFRPETDKQVSIEVYNGEKRFDHVRFQGDPGRVHIFQKEPENIIGWMLAYENHISKCFGYLEGDIERLDRILRRAGTGQVSVRDKMEDLNGTAHYVIDAKTEHGQYTIWLNPEKGYNFSKAILAKKTGDLLMGENLDALGDYTFKSIIRNTDFKKVDGVWVPFKGTAEMKMKRNRQNRQNESNTALKRDIELTSILINPDHDALDSFSIDGIRDGAKASVIGNGPSGEYVWRDGYVWQDGKVLDADGKIFMDCNTKAKSK